MKPMIERVVAERLAPRAGGLRVLRRVLKIAGRGESRRGGADAADLLDVARRHASDRDHDSRHAGTGRAAPLDARQRDRRHGGGARAGRRRRSTRCWRPTSSAATGARSRKSSAICCARAAGGSRSPNRAPAASPTSRLTDVAGSSDYVERGVVVYSNESKIDLLGVAPALDRRARRRERAGGRSDGGAVFASAPVSRSAWGSPASPVPAAGANRSRSAPSASRWSLRQRGMCKPYRFPPGGSRARQGVRRVHRDRQVRARAPLRRHRHRRRDARASCARVRDSCSSASWTPPQRRRASTWVAADERATSPSDSSAK